MFVILHCIQEFTWVGSHVTRSVRGFSLFVVHIYVNPLIRRSPSLSKADFDSGNKHGIRLDRNKIEPANGLSDQFSVPV